MESTAIALSLQRKKSKKIACQPEKSRYGKCSTGPESDKKFRSCKALMRCIDLISQHNIIYHGNHERCAQSSDCLKVTLTCNIAPTPHKYLACKNCSAQAWKEVTERQFSKASTQITEWYMLLSGQFDTLILWSFWFLMWEVNSKDWF